MEESKEQTYEMLRRVAGDSSAVEPFDRLTIKLGCAIAYSYSGQSVVLRALAASRPSSAPSPRRRGKVFTTS